MKIELFNLKNRYFSKTIRVYLPKEYYTSNCSYPVLYMQDGQNLFKTSNNHPNNMCWYLEEILEKFELQDINIIVVGIESNHFQYERFNEYSPWKNSMNQEILEKRELPADIGGKGDLYSNFLIDTIKPFIDNNFRTLSNFENTFIGGSSMGAIISLYIALENQNLFSKLMLFSIATWFCEKELTEYLRKKSINSEIKIYLDIGTNESSSEKIQNFPQIYLEGFYKIQDILNKKLPPSQFLTFIEPFGKHNEFAWNRRFPIALNYILTKNNLKLY